MPSNFALLIFFAGGGFGLYTLKCNTLSNFNITPEIKENASLITIGAYRYIRHPMYFSVLVMMLGVLVSKPSVLSLFIFALLVVTLFLKAHKEEMLWMVESSEYKNYRQQTKKIIPFVL
ncbi:MULTISPECIES: isoprenylcysteine carboxylmethyltransferase family protein [unclassified Sulfurospirillum]|uniref:methyltransferase family protein n=1 Tax=unclassified Sulfurospirillum TaxID=2618290 RepID=UPI00068B7D99|nr:MULTISPECIES: isoprenylcysteine carboxylmethyltransferase family protein [unclassified Sulfurospirillum]